MEVFKGWIWIWLECDFKSHLDCQNACRHDHDINCTGLHFECIYTASRTCLIHFIKTFGLVFKLNSNLHSETKCQIYSLTTHEASTISYTQHSRAVNFRRLFIHVRLHLILFTSNKTSKLI